MKEFVIGDIHGGYLGLKQVLERANFDYDNDKLIALGDVCDGWPDTAECIEELLKIKNLVYCLGNHDEWARRYLNPNFGEESVLEKMRREHGYTSWYHQGGAATAESYKKHPGLLEKHVDFLFQGKLYYLDEKNRLFLHAGFDWDHPIDEQAESTYYWDREMISMVFNPQHETPDLSKYSEIYIGHTPTLGLHYDPEWVLGKPLNRINLWAMDTGATYMGKLSMMEINTKELFQSDPMFTLYPKHKGRNGSHLTENSKWNSWGLFPGENW